MTVKPILFNTEMVRAIFDGRKTQTRRIVKGLEGLNVYRVEPSFADTYDTPCSFDFFHGWSDHGAMFDAIKTVKAPYSVGNILWVRETFDNVSLLHPWYYKADGDLRPECRKGERWLPSIHMPKEAARIFLRVTDIWVERLKDISNEDVIAEGIPFDWPMNPVYCSTCNGTGLFTTHNPDSLGHMDFDCPDCAEPTKRFKNLWNSTIKTSDIDKYGWSANPWVWVIEFERCEKPEGWCG